MGEGGGGEDMTQQSGNSPHVYKTFQMGNRGTWCKYCNHTFKENPQHIDPMNKDTLFDYVVAHGLGQPTKKGYEVARMLIASGCDYATTASEIISRGLTK